MAKTKQAPLTHAEDELITREEAARLLGTTNPTITDRIVSGVWKYCYGANTLVYAPQGIRIRRSCVDSILRGDYGETEFKKTNKEDSDNGSN